MPQASPGTHLRRVVRRLEARGEPGLGEILARLEGTLVGGRFRLDRLYAVGAEGAVYLATSMDDAVPSCVAKVPLVPHHRPAELSSSLLRRRRDALRTEAHNLDAASSVHMPAGRGLFEFVNPLLDRRRGGAFAEVEPVLVMERLAGRDVDLWLARIHRSSVPRPLLRRHIDRTVVVLLQALEDLRRRGFLYADLRPGNLRMIGRPTRRIRLLDAGSLVAIDDPGGRFPHVPHYLPPELFVAHYLRDAPIASTAAVQSVMAGRTLYEIATGRVPVPGGPIDESSLSSAGVLSPPVLDVVSGLAAGDFPDLGRALRYLERHALRRAASSGAPVAAQDAPAPAAASVGPAPLEAREAERAAIPAAPMPAPPVRPSVWSRIRDWFRRLGSRNEVRRVAASDPR